MQELKARHQDAGPYFVCFYRITMGAPIPEFCPPEAMPLHFTVQTLHYDHFYEMMKSSLTHVSFVLGELLNTGGFFGGISLVFDLNKRENLKKER
jgi:hypothetical protein